MKEIETGGIIPISGMSISEISDADLEQAFYAVVAQHKDAVLSIHKSMKEADSVWLKYVVDEYYEPSEEEAKKDRAALNRCEKNVAEKYSELKTAYEKPLQTIELNIKAIRNAIKDRSSMVDSSVKAYEEKQKSKKRERIEAYWKASNFDLVPLEKIFDPRWLNKTYKLQDTLTEIDGIIAKIHSDIKTLESISEYGTIAKSEYLESLDMGSAMKKVEVLKENAERLAREKLERERREMEAQIKINAIDECVEERESVSGAKSLAEEALHIEPDMPDEQPEIIEYTLRFKGTREQLFRLKKFMTFNGISYEKL